MDHRRRLHEVWPRADDVGYRSHLVGGVFVASTMVIITVFRIPFVVTGPERRSETSRSGRWLHAGDRRWQRRTTRASTLRRRPRRIVRESSPPAAGRRASWPPLE